MSAVVESVGEHEEETCKALESKAFDDANAVVIENESTSDVVKKKKKKKKKKKQGCTALLKCSDCHTTQSYSYESALLHYEYD